MSNRKTVIAAAVILLATLVVWNSEVLAQGSRRGLSNPTKERSDQDAYKGTREYQAASPAQRKKADEAVQKQEELKDRASQGKLTDYEKKALGLTPAQQKHNNTTEN